ncbi:MAG TPA: MBL fold metallo-hydrolase [Candidatus Paceibacterota bacterium]|nr:MBL fold metallo-hydrolase [Candidatus Paceibacterota bacterium]
MKIKKISHCCLVIELGGKTILTDPGSFSNAQDSLTGIDAVVITHEHGDHFHAESVRAIVKNNPEAMVIANAAVGKLLDGLGVAHTVVDGRGKAAIGEVAIEAFDCRHEEIFEEIGQVSNTAYLMSAGGRSFFIPGDAYCDPGAAAKVDVLALPVASPWCRLRDALRYAIKVGPHAAFPIHDAVLRQDTSGFLYQLAERVLKERGITFTALHDGGGMEF